jgi:hypothetical protein
VFPDDWKSAVITPIFKAGDPTDVAKYRPICILPIISKVVEEVVANQLIAHLNSGHSPLYPMQFGFRTHHSTEMANCFQICQRLSCDSCFPGFKDSIRHSEPQCAAIQTVNPQTTGTHKQMDGILSEQKKTMHQKSNFQHLPTALSESLKDPFCAHFNLVYTSMQMYADDTVFYCMYMSRQSNSRLVKLQQQRTK